MVGAGNCSRCVNYQALLVEKEKKITELVYQNNNWIEKQAKWKARKTEFQGKLGAVEKELKKTEIRLQQVVYREKCASIFIVFVFGAALIMSIISS